MNNPQSRKYWLAAAFLAINAPAFAQTATLKKTSIGCTSPTIAIQANEMMANGGWNDSLRIARLNDLIRLEICTMKEPRDVRFRRHDEGMKLSCFADRIMDRECIWFRTEDTE